MREDIKNKGREIGEKGLELLADAVISTAGYVSKAGRIIRAGVNGGIERVTTEKNREDFKSGKGWEKALYSSAAFLGGAYWGGRDEYETFRGPERKLFLKGTGLSVLALGAVGWHYMQKAPSENMTGDNQSGFSREMPDSGMSLAEYGARPAQIVNELSQFKGINQVLLLCSDREQYRLVVGAFQSRDRSSSNDVNISRVEQGKFCIGGFSCEMPNGERSRVPLIIVNAEEVSDSEIRREIRERNLNPNFSFIGLRGHTVDMPELFDRASGFQQEKCFFQLGGCVASDYIPNYGTPNTPIAGSSSVAYAPRNNNWSLLMIEAINNPNTHTWSDVRQHINERSVTAQDELVLPQDHSP